MLVALPPPTLGRLLTTLAFDPGVVLLVVVAGTGYAAGVRRLSRRAGPAGPAGTAGMAGPAGTSPPAGRPHRWPRGRTAAFAAGLVVLLVATCSGLGAYDTSSFAVHVGQHVLLGMVGPLLLAAGAPVTLALQAAPRRWQQALLSLVHHPVTAALTHPVVAWVLFGGTLWALYWSPLIEASLEHGWVHAAVHLHFLASGYLFCWTALGIDPSRRRVGWPARALFVFVNVPFHALLGLAVRSGASEPLGSDVYVDWARRWGTSAAAGQRTGAGLLWAAGEVFGGVLLAWVALRWYRAELRAQAREDRRLDAALPASDPAAR